MDEDELLLESEDSDSIAENRSCMNFPMAMRGSSVELVESVDEVEPVAVAEPLVVVTVLESGGGPPGGVGMEIPIWLRDSIILCIRLSLPPCWDPVPETWVSEVPLPLFDCENRER